MEENSQLQRKLEQTQSYQTLLLTQLMAGSHNPVLGNMGLGSGISGNIQNMYSTFGAAAPASNLSQLPLGQASILSQLL